MEPSELLRRFVEVLDRLGIRNLNAIRELRPCYYRYVH